MLNERIARSTSARERAAELDGRRFTVIVDGMDLSLTLVAANGGVELRVPAEPDADATLRAGALELLQLSRAETVSELKRSDAHLEGNLHVADAFAGLLRHAQPELEEELAPWLGDIAAHEIGRGLRGFSDWARRAARALEQDLGEYLTEETPTLAQPTRVRAFLDAVDRLRDDVDRAERRIELLERASPSRR